MENQLYTRTKLLAQGLALPDFKFIHLCNVLYRSHAPRKYSHPVLPIDSQTPSQVDGRMVSRKLDALQPVIDLGKVRRNLVWIAHSNGDSIRQHPRS